jgi:hypothetical protein
MTDDQTMQLKRGELTDEQRRLLQAAREQFAQITSGAVTTSGVVNTGKLEEKVDAPPQMPHRNAFGLKVGDATEYRVLPPSMADEANRNPLVTRWRIEITGLGPGISPQGLDICGDVVLGRSAGNVDLDFSPYNAVEHGVSRRHAMLRPSSSKLYLIDLNSTNGTRCNSVVVSGARALHHLDTISLGGLTFQIKIIDQR